MIDRVADSLAAADPELALLSVVGLLSIASAAVVLEDVLGRRAET